MSFSFAGKRYHGLVLDPSPLKSNYLLGLWWLCPSTFKHFFFYFIDPAMKSLSLCVSYLLSPQTLPAGLYPSKRVCPCGRVSVRNRYFSFNFDTIATKIVHNLDQTFSSPACALRDDLLNFELFCGQKCSNIFNLSCEQ